MSAVVYMPARWSRGKKGEKPKIGWKVAGVTRSQRSRKKDKVKGQGHRQSHFCDVSACV